MSSIEVGIAIIAELSEDECEAKDVIDGVGCNEPAFFEAVEREELSVGPCVCVAVNFGDDVGV